MIGLLLGLTLSIWGIHEFKKSSEDIKIRQKLGHTDQTFMVKILEKESSPQRNYFFFRLDKSLDDLCFKGQVTVEGITRNITVIAPTQTQIGQTHMMRGWLFPSWKLFLPKNDSLYYFKVRIGQWIPYLRPKAIIMKKSPNA